MGPEFVENRSETLSARGTTSTDAFDTMEQEVKPESCDSDPLHDSVPQTVIGTNECNESSDIPNIKSEINEDAFCADSNFEGTILSLKNRPRSEGTAVSVKQEQVYFAETAAETDVDWNVKVKEEFEFGEVTPTNENFADQGRGVGKPSCASDSWTFSHDPFDMLSAYVLTCMDAPQTIKEEVQFDDPSNEVAAQKATDADGDCNTNYCSGAGEILNSDLNDVAVGADADMEIKNEADPLLAVECIINAGDDEQDQPLPPKKPPRKWNPYNGTFICQICFKQFTTKFHLQQHLLIHSEKKQFECDVCHKRFRQKSGLWKHQKTHSLEKQFKCDSCEKKFKQKQHLQQHALIHSEETLFECVLCMKRFKVQAYLQRHLLRHSEEKRFKCHLCPKQFYTKENFQKHCLIHMKAKPFRCHLCPKQFYLEETLTKHLATHLRRRFTCDVCQKPFRKKSDFSQHILSHSNEPPIECDLCKKRFKLKRYLQTHLLRHTEEKRFECDTCKKQFKQKIHLQRHLLSIHSKSEAV